MQNHRLWTVSYTDGTHVVVKADSREEARDWSRANYPSSPIAYIIKTAIVDAEAEKQRREPRPSAHRSIGVLAGAGVLCENCGKHPVAEWVSGVLGTQYAVCTTCAKEII